MLLSAIELPRELKIITSIAFLIGWCLEQVSEIDFNNSRYVQVFAM